MKALAHRIVRILNRPSPRRFPRYASFAEAAAHTTGYEDPEIVGIVARKTEQFRQALGARTERRIEDRQTLQNLFVMRHASVSGPVNVIDVGGACGANYFLLDHLLPHCFSRWVVLETPGMAEAAHRQSGDRLQFATEWGEALAAVGSRGKCLLFASGVLQYLPDPAAALREWSSAGVGWIYLTRTLLLSGDREEVLYTAQQTRVSDHGPGVLAEGAPPKLSSQPLTLQPQRLIEEQLGADYTLQYIFEEGPDEPVQVGDRRTSLRTAGYLYRLTQELTG